MLIKERPSMDQWIEEAKKADNADKVGMYLFHNGVVRETPRAVVRQGEKLEDLVKKIEFSYDEDKVNRAIEEAYTYNGLYYIRVWLNQGTIDLGDDIMYVLIGGDIRPNVIDGLQRLVGKIKTECVVEKEII